MFVLHLSVFVRVQKDVIGTVGAKMTSQVSNTRLNAFTITPRKFCAFL